MGKRSRRHHSTDDLTRERSLLDAIADGKLDDHLTALAGAVDARRRLLHTVRSATALAVLRVGDEVRINHAVSPRYLAGLHGTVIEVDDQAATVRLPRPVGRFSSGRVRCPPLALDKLTGVAA
ncbi:MAG: preprotein translocase subunit YajC [Actinomycetota bacterium]|nr:preprotein translocase subunit YajC [Actinomycetota bacterium]